MPTRAPHRPATDGALLRLTVGADNWAEGVPPAPHDADVTVSFSDADTAALHGDALRLLGYRIVGVRPTGAADVLARHPAADILIPQAMLESYPTWWRALADQADRAYSLALGPVLASLSEVLRPHLAAARTAGAPTRRRRALPR
jgi:hypothetical protein